MENNLIAELDRLAIYGYWRLWLLELMATSGVYWVLELMESTRTQRQIGDESNANFVNNTTRANSCRQDIGWYLAFGIGRLATRQRNGI